MNQRNWELLEKQLGRTNFYRQDDSLAALMVAAVFFVGIAFGSLAVTHQGSPVRVASNHTTAAAMVCDHNGACRIRSHVPTAATLSAL